MQHTCPYCGAEPTEIAGLSFDRSTSSVTFRGKTCRLTPRTFDMVRDLADAGPRGVSKATFMDRLYNHNVFHSTPESKILDVYTCKIRRAFRDAGMALTVISNYERGGLEYSRLFLVVDPPRVGATSYEVQRAVATA